MDLIIQILGLAFRDSHSPTRARLGKRCGVTFRSSEVAHANATLSGPRILYHKKLPKGLPLEDRIPAMVIVSIAAYFALR